MQGKTIQPQAGGYLTEEGQTLENNNFNAGAQVQANRMGTYRNASGADREARPSVPSGSPGQTGHQPSGTKAGFDHVPTCNFCRSSPNFDIVTLNLLQDALETLALSRIFAPTRRRDSNSELSKLGRGVSNMPTMTMRKKKKRGRGKSN